MSDSSSSASASAGDAASSRDADLLAGFFVAGAPGLRFDARPGTLTPAEIGARAARLQLPAPRRKLLLGLALLWNDCWDAAHGVAQEHEGQSDFDLLHAIGHRREGDYGNCNYWLRSAQAHPCFAALERALLREFPEDDELRKALLPDGRWSPEAFVEAVSAAASAGKGAPAKSANFTESPARLARIQELEFRAFAEWLLSG